MNVTCKWQAHVRPSIPVLQVSGILFHPDGRVLLLKDEGKYHLPGGKPEAGEDEVLTLQREAFEEARVTITNPTYLGFVAVDEESGKRRYAQVRYIARIEQFLPASSDPSTGRTDRRVILPPAEAAARLAWGTHGDDQFVDAAKLALELWHLRPTVDAIDEIPLEGSGCSL